MMRTREREGNEGWMDNLVRFGESSFFVRGVSVWFESRKNILELAHIRSFEQI